MPAAYSQQSAALRAERQAKAGYTSIGRDVNDYTQVNGRVRRRERIGDPLPEHAPGGEEWAVETRNWYFNFQLSPQAALLVTDIDWQMLVLAAGLLNIFYKTGSLPAYSRFEALVSKFGVTPADRRKLRLAITMPEEPVGDEQSASEDAEAFDDEFEALTKGLLS